MEYFGAGAHDAGPQRVSDRNVRNTDDDNSQPNRLAPCHRRTSTTTPRPPGVPTHLACLLVRAARARYGRGEVDLRKDTKSVRLDYESVLVFSSTLNLRWLRSKANNLLRCFSAGWQPSMPSRGSPAPGSHRRERAPITLLPSSTLPSVSNAANSFNASLTQSR